jgi:hypothetical protein
MLDSILCACHETFAPPASMPRQSRRKIPSKKSVVPVRDHRWRAVGIGRREPARDAAARERQESQ